MTCWALLAVKPPHLGKSRLASVLSGAQRERLIRVMLARVLDALDAAEEIDQIAVVTPATELLPRGVIALDDPGGGLNHALGAGRRALIARGADEVLVLHADLPSLSAAAIVTRLRSAISDSRPLWIGYADTDGAVTQQIVEPIRVAAGVLTAFDHRTEQVRPFAVSRITGVADLPPDAVEG